MGCRRGYGRWILYSPAESVYYPPREYVLPFGYQGPFVQVGRGDGTAVAEMIDAVPPQLADALATLIDE